MSPAHIMSRVLSADSKFNFTVHPLRGYFASHCSAGEKKLTNILTLYFFTNTIILLAIKDINMENIINFIALYLIGFLIGNTTIKILSFIKNTTLNVLTFLYKKIKNKK